MISSATDLLQAMSESGWAVARGSLDDGEALAREAGWHEVKMKAGSSVVELRPRSRQDAPPRSLSAVYGTDAQPLHSDGAHMPAPPRWVLLSSALPTATGTLVWTPSMGPGPLPEGAKSGLFTVRGNGASFLASAETPAGLRYDPGCMNPADSLAREARDYFDVAIAFAHRHTWDVTDLLLFIDNRRALHAREKVGSDLATRSIRRIAFDTTEDEAS